MYLNNRDKEIIKKCIDSGIPIPEKYKAILFEEPQEIDLIWQGQCEQITNIVLPFQIIEQIDEPRQNCEENEILDLLTYDGLGRQLSGWSNKLVWGDNKLILSSLKNGPLREEIEREGGLKMVYIDPPFSAGLDYTIDVPIGESPNVNATKYPSIIEEFAYRNTWGNGGSYFLTMLYERIILIRDLLSSDGIFLLRIDYHFGHYVKIILDKIFGKNNFQSELIVNRIKKNVTAQGRLSLPNATDSIFVYFKSDQSRFVHLNQPLAQTREGYWRRTDDSSGERNPRDRTLFNTVFSPPPGKHFKFSQAKMEMMIDQGTLRFNEKLKRLEYFVPPTDSKILDTNWTDIPGYSFTTGYPTENSEILLSRIISICTNEGDLIADFFCGSGTTLAVAEKMNRKWIGADIGRFAIHTTRKRMIETQRLKNKEGKPFRSFQLLNLGKYERQWYIGINPNLSSAEQQKLVIQKEELYLNLILQAYKAERVLQLSPFHGKHAQTAIFVGPIDSPVTISQVNEIISASKEYKITKVDVLGFEFEMGLVETFRDQAKLLGINLALKYIPKDVFDKRAIMKGQVKFFDASYLEVLPTIVDRSVIITLTDCGIFYTQEDLDLAIEVLKPGTSKVIVHNGQIMNVSKNKKGIVAKPQILTTHWSDWIDYWAIDYNFESRKEFIYLNSEKGKNVKTWTGSYIFENMWQAFRTKKNRHLEIKAEPFQYELSGYYKIAVKVIDIFGNDTTKVIGVNI